MTVIKTERPLQEKSPFMSYEAVDQLHQLVDETPNLSSPHELTPTRLVDCCAEACGYKLLYATERVNDEILEALGALAAESRALEKMQRMQEGEVVNFVTPYPSENRPALHTATRDFFSLPSTAMRAKEAARLAREEIEKLKILMAKWELENCFDDLVVIGIGGSELGPRANYEALRYLAKPGRRVHFIANIDPDDASATLHTLDLRRTVAVSISKSGTTLETDTNEEWVRDKFKRAKLNPREHFISVTMPSTPMDNREKYSETFYLWDWIGGRYSSTSMVGGLILAFAYGFDVYWEFLRGAHDMDRNALEPGIKNNLPLLEALLGIWNRNFLRHPTFGVIPYSQGLRYYPAHLQQLDMESNGKLIGQHGEFVDFDTGPIVWGSLGTNAQHSFFQLLHQGTAAVPLLMIGFKKNQYGEDLAVQGTTSQEKLLANLFAQSLALALGSQKDNLNRFCPGNRPTHILLGEQLTPYALGALLAFYEHKVAFQGFIWGINSFDQEGVQLGKKLASGFIECFAARHDKAMVTQADPLAEAYLGHLDNFRATPISS